MAPRWSLEQITASISKMGKRELRKRIRSFRGKFKMDFTEDYLNRASVDRLRHILLAAMINAKV